MSSAELPAKAAALFYYVHDHQGWAPHIQYCEDGDPVRSTKEMAEYWSSMHTIPREHIEYVPVGPMLYDSHPPEGLRGNKMTMHCKLSWEELMKMFPPPPPKIQKDPKPEEVSSVEAS
jgi:hypothetical protein